MLKVTETAIGNKMIKVTQLTKIFDYGKKTECLAVDKIDFECQKGKVFGLLGLNGAGKTTTLRMMATILKPTAGTIEMDDLDVVRDAERVRERIGFLTGDTGLYSRFTVRETLSYFGRLYDIEEEKLEERIKFLSEMLDMDSFLDRRVEKLSTGMKQKVSVARTIVHDPPIMILDEPTAGLDVISAETIVEFIKQCRSENKCVVFSTHIMQEAEMLCDTIGIIHKGKVMSMGTLEELKERTSKRTLKDLFFELVKGNNENRKN